MKLKKIFQLALVLSQKKFLCLEEIEKKVITSLLPMANPDPFYANAILDKTFILENNVKLKNLFDILKICAEAQNHPPANFEPLNKLQSLKNTDLFKDEETSIQEKYLEFFDEAFAFIKEKKISLANTKLNAKTPTVTKPAGNFIGDLKATLLKRPKPNSLPIEKKNILEKPQETNNEAAIKVTPALIQARANSIVTSLKRDTPKTSVPLQPKAAMDNKKLISKEFTAEKQKTELLQQEIKSLKQKLETSHKKLESQHKLLLIMQQNAKEAAKKSYEMETKLDDIFSLYYLVDPYFESNITTKEIAELVHYIAQDFRLDFVHKSALASLSPNDKLRDSFNKLYEDYHRVNQDILLDNKSDYQTEDKKVLNNVTKEICLSLQKTFKQTDEKSKPEQWCVIFLAEILKRIKNLEPDSSISQLAEKCGNAFIERNIKKLVEDAKNIQKYLNSPKNKNPVGLFNTATQQNNSSLIDFTSPYISAVTGLLSSAYSKAFG